MFSLQRVRDRSLSVVPNIQAAQLLQEAYSNDLMRSDPTGDDTGSYAFEDPNGLLWVLEPLGPSWYDALANANRKKNE